MRASRRRALHSGMAALAGLALVLGGCGRRGSLKPPKGEGAAYTHPRSYPAPKTVLPEGTTDFEKPLPAADPPPERFPFAPSRSKRYGS